LVLNGVPRLTVATGPEPFTEMVAAFAHPSVVESLDGRRKWRLETGIDARLMLEIGF
jgi:hypothetical protein